MARGPKKGYWVSLRYKLALPVWVFVFLILALLTHTTIRLIREFVADAFEARILSETEAFADSIKADFFLRHYSELRSHLNWMTGRGDVLGIQIVDREGMLILKSETHPGPEAKLVAAEPVTGVRELSSGLYLATAPVRLGTKEPASVQIFFSGRNVHATVRAIYRERIFLSFLAGLAIAVITAAWTWITIRPLFRLQSTVQEILRGRTEARAKIHTRDEIEDLAEAFNEMVNRLQRSLENLRVRSAAFEESEERYRVLVENASDVIWLLSPEGEIMFLNQGFAGLSRTTLLEGGLKLFLALLAEESAKKFEAALAEAKRSKVPAAHLETIYRHPETRADVYYSTNLNPVLTRTGELRAVQAVSRDVTELKRIEMMKERLIRDVAHELKTPVAKFQMTLGWLEKELGQKGAGGKYTDILDLMHRNADLLMKIIMEVMDLSRLESGTERIVRKPCDLNQILSRVYEDLEPLAREKKLPLKKELSAGALSFEGDEAMLYRLFSNLVINALKFTPEGEIVILSENGEGKLRAKVRDTGIGLENTDLGRIFDRFYQKTPATHGLGLGLSLAREIVMLHGGRIWAESEGPGKGATFVVEFPQ